MKKTDNLNYCIYAFNSQYFKVGEAKWIYTFNESNLEHHRQITNIKSVLIVISKELNNDVFFKELGLQRQKRSNSYCIS